MISKLIARGIHKHHRLRAMMLFAMAVSLSAAILQAEKVDHLEPAVRAPSSWLIWASLPRLGEIEAKVDTLLAPFGTRLVGAKHILQTYCGNALSEDRPVVAGFAASEQESNEAAQSNNSDRHTNPEPFLILPIEDLNKFAAARQFSMEEDLWITTLLGVEFRVTPLEGAVWITRLNASVQVPNDAQITSLLDSQLLDAKLLDTNSLAQATSNDRLLISLSKTGFQYLKTTAERERKSLLSKPRQKIPPLKLPRTLPEALEQLTRYVPFLNAIEKASTQEEVILMDCETQLNENSLKLKLSFYGSSSSTSTAEVNESKAEDAKRSATPLVELLPENQIINETYSAGTIDPTLLDLTAGYFLCYPDEIEANTYHEKAYANYTSHLNDLLQLASSIETVDLLVEESQPLAANRVTLLQFPKESCEGVDEAFAEVVSLWNQVINDSRARLKFEAKQEATQIESLSGQKLEMVSIKIDMIKAFGGRRYEEIIALFEAIYGPDCIFRTDLIDMGDGRWLLSRLPKEQNLKIIEQLFDKSADDAASKAPWQLNSTIYPTRYQDWNIRLDKISNRETIGHRPKAAIADCPPIRINLKRQPSGLEATIELPMSTYRAGVDFFRQSK